VGQSGEFWLAGVQEPLRKKSMWGNSGLRLLFVPAYCSFSNVNIHFRTLERDEMLANVKSCRVASQIANAQFHLSSKKQ
jgi:hypothetical protein